jgi:acyl-CoA synthetase (NDP forming)
VSGVVGGDGAGAFVGTASGGGAGVTADLAARHGVPFAQLSGPTVERLRAVLPEGAYVGNPLDINTANAAEVYAALTDEPAVRYLIEPWSLPWPTADDEYHWQRATMGRLADTARTTGLPVIVASIWHQPVSEWMQAFAAENGIDASPDLELTLAALAALSRSTRLPGDLPARPAATAPGHAPAAPRGMVAEAAARELLASAGVPVVRGAEVGDADAAVALADELTAPFAVKLSLDTVGHKERVGGVVLGVRDAEGVREACDRIRANAVAAGVSDGSDVRYLVTEMVSGPEILVGAMHDPIAGPCATVAIGGWAAEAGAIFGTVPLPASAAEITERVASWNLPHLLGERRAADLAGFLTSLSAAVEGPLAGYREIEINPVMLTPRGALVVDALLIG